MDADEGRMNHTLKKGDIITVGGVQYRYLHDVAIEDIAEVLRRHANINSYEWVPGNHKPKSVLKDFDKPHSTFPDGPASLTRGLVNVKGLIPEDRPVDKLLAKVGFNSGDAKRVTNNPTNLDDYEGPDDVSMRYRPLSDTEKSDMGEIKLLTQQLINKIRSVAVSHIDDATGFVKTHIAEQYQYIEKAVENAQLTSIWATKYITGPR